VSTATTFEEKGEPKRIRTEVPLLASLTPYRWPNRLTGDATLISVCGMPSGPANTAWIGTMKLGPDQHPSHLHYLHFRARIGSSLHSYFTHAGPKVVN